MLKKILCGGRLEIRLKHWLHENVVKVVVPKYMFIEYSKYLKITKVISRELVKYLGIQLCAVQDADPRYYLHWYCT